MYRLGSRLDAEAEEDEGEAIGRRRSSSSSSVRGRSYICNVFKQTKILSHLFLPLPSPPDVFLTILTVTPPSVDF